jgi:hypothetical protein
MVDVTDSDEEKSSSHQDLDIRRVRKEAAATRT